MGYSTSAQPFRLRTPCDGLSSWGQVTSYAYWGMSSLLTHLVCHFKASLFLFLSFTCLYWTKGILHDYVIWSDRHPQEVSYWCRPAIATAVADIRRDIWLTVLNNHAVFLSYYSRTCLMTSNENSEVLPKHISPLLQFIPHEIIFILPVAKDHLSWERLHNSMVTNKKRVFILRRPPGLVSI